jgi:hypothetical protein
MVNPDGGWIAVLPLELRDALALLRSRRAFALAGYQAAGTTPPFNCRYTLPKRSDPMENNVSRGRGARLASAAPSSRRSARPTWPKAGRLFQLAVREALGVAAPARIYLADALLHFHRSAREFHRVTGLDHHGEKVCSFRI